MSDTPFTDSCSYGFTDEDGIHCEAVHADIARTLERERDRYKSEVEVITRERDEALNKAHNYEQGYLTHAARADTLEKERNSLQDQRDFCMGEIERLRKEAAQKDKLLAEMRAAIRWAASNDLTQ